MKTLLKKDIRPILSGLLLIYLFLNWITFNMKTDTFGYTTDVSDSYIGYSLLGVTYVSFLLPLIPIILLCIAFLPALDKHKKALYPLGALFGIVSTIISMLVVSSVLSASSSSDGISVKSRGVWGIGIWLTLITYAAILVLSLIMDFKLSSQVLKEQGLKGALSNVVDEVATSTSALASSVKSGELKKDIATTAHGVPCPQCNNPIAFGKKFCAKCGYKIEPANLTDQSPSSTIDDNPDEQAISSASLDNDIPSPGSDRNFPRIKSMSGNKTSAAKVQSTPKYSGVVCENCFCVSDINGKYCPDCGSKLHPVRKCGFCGETLIEGKTFCAECGTPIDYRKHCTKCNAEIIPGKAFCTECGTPVSYERTCSACGAVVIEGKSFCPDCGTPYSKIN